MLVDDGRVALNKHRCTSVGRCLAGLATKSASHSAVERRRQISRSSIFSKTGSGGVKAGESRLG